MIPAIFEKGYKFCDFLFASLGEKSSALSTEREKNFSSRSKFFLIKVHAREEGRKNKKQFELFSQKVDPFTLNLCAYLTH